MSSKKKLALNNHSTTKTTFALKFLSSLYKIRRDNYNKVNGGRLSSSSASSQLETRRRSNRIKVAAYSSMARAVGSKRVWSRALLLKLRNRSRLRSVRPVSKKGKITFKGKVRSEMGKVDMLRNLVPGGETMDFCGLLDETAHYMKCLATQVKVMQSIVDHYTKQGEQLHE